jgi:hypothetical protein
MFDIYTLTEKNTKQFVMERLGFAERSTNEAVRKAMTSQAYGAIQFAANYCFPDYNIDLVNWWGNEARPKFEKLLDK